MQKVIAFFFLVGLFSLISCSNTGKQNTGDKNSDTYTLIWSDEFNYNGLPDSTKWDYDTEGNAFGWGNNEAQFYTVADTNNAWVNGNSLHITALKKEHSGKAYTSARLISKPVWQYGKIETRAKLPAGRGTWAAIWMMPGDWTFNDGNWPDVGEIDIMEHVGHDFGIVHASAHSKDYQWQKGSQKTGTIAVQNVDSEYHTYTLEWSKTALQAYVDDSLYFEYKNEKLGPDKWPYDKPFYLILNVAIGGAWGSVKGIDEEAFPQQMQIDYVRVYRLEDQE